MKLNPISAPLFSSLIPSHAGLAVIGMFAMAPVYGVEFDLADGELTGSLDTTLSYGALWRVQGQDRENDGINSNDGNRNFDTGLVSQVFKITSDFELNWQDYGFFARGTAFYDAELHGSTRFGKASWQSFQPSQAGRNGTRPDNRFTTDAKKISGRDAKLLDAYVYGSWEPLDYPLDIRLGKQVLNWGEGIFYRNGINTTNPIDVAQFRLPGAELKEALIPVEALVASLGVSDNLSVDAFYQWKFRKAAFEPVGTFFSETDLFAEGGHTAYSAGSLAPAVQAYENFATGGNLPGISGNANVRFAGNGIAQVGRIGKDIEARDKGQFGISFRYLAEELNDTEFGAYFVNYHGKEPVIYASLDKKFTGVIFSNLVPALSGNAVVAGGIATIELLNNVEANRKYVEDIRMYGLSFSTSYGNTSFAGELAYRPNFPVGMSTTNDLIGDIAAQGAQLAGGNGGNIAGQQVNLGGAINNYQRVESYNLSLSAIHNFGPVLNFDALFGIVELASEHLRGSSLTYQSRNGSRKFAGRGDCEYASFRANGGDGSCDKNDQITPNAWGYTAVMAGTWNDAFAGVTLKPYVRWRQGVKGNSHRTGNFLKGAYSLTTGMSAHYLELEVDLKYTGFGGPDTFDTRDRDNIALGIKYSL